jgi:hypothetical protein
VRSKNETAVREEVFRIIGQIKGYSRNALETEGLGEEIMEK